MKRRVVLLLFVCFMCISSVVPCCAAEFLNPPIVDGANYLFESEFAELSEKAEAVRQKYNFDVAIVTEVGMTGSDAVSAADDIYDYLGYGAGENADGIMLYICKETRDYWFTTRGDGLRVFNDNGIEYLKREVVSHLSEEDYYSAMEKYITLSEELLEMAANGMPYNEETTDVTYVLIILGCALLIPLIVALIATNGKMSQMKTAVENDYASDYVKNGSKNIRFSRDIFLYSHIDKRAKPKEQSSSHVSSSGKTHGGGGGKF